MELPKDNSQSLQATTTPTSSSTEQFKQSSEVYLKVSESQVTALLTDQQFPEDAKAAIYNLLSPLQLAQIHDAIRTHNFTRNLGPGRSPMEAIAKPLSTFVDTFPVEIRLEIYQHLLVRPILGHPQALEAGTAYELHSSFMRVCRKVYKETCDVLYGHNSFILDGSNARLPYWSVNPAAWLPYRCPLQ